jgi:predicted dienelactone hydrolase
MLFCACQENSKRLVGVWWEFQALKSGRLWQLSGACVSTVSIKRGDSVFKLLCGLLFLTSVLCGTANATESPFRAGVSMVQLNDPVSQQSMKAAVFYPTKDEATVTRLGPLEIAAKRDATIQGGRFPLVLLSHGNGGSMFSHHGTAVSLASQGFVVAAIEHPGDNFKDDSGQGSDRVFIGRQQQLTALLDFLLGRSAFKQAIDSQKIGVMGFSAGAYTALVMVGAKPNFDLLKRYCERVPKNILCAGQGQVRWSTPALKIQADNRVRAAFVMSPLGVVFEKENLASVTAPVYVYAAAADSVLPLHDHALAVKSKLQSLTQYTEIPGADHYVFLSPCSEQMKNITPTLCTDPPGVDRLAIHRQMNADALAFFRTELR